MRKILMLLVLLIMPVMYVLAGGAELTWIKGQVPDPLGKCHKKSKFNDRIRYLSL